MTSVYSFVEKDSVIFLEIVYSDKKESIFTLSSNSLLDSGLNSFFMPQICKSWFIILSIFLVDKSNPQ